MTGAESLNSQVDFLEAAYAWELDDESWLRGLVAAASRVWGNPVWACGYEYDASDVHRFRPGPPLYVGADPRVPELLAGMVAAMPPEDVARTYRKVSAAFGRHIGGLSPEAARALETIRTADYFGINGIDPSGLGCFIGIGAERTDLHPHEQGLYERLSSHVASAYRCRRRLRARAAAALTEWEALLNPDGRLLDARGPARDGEARQAIQQAARIREEARRQADRSEPTTSWRPRIQGRWTLVDAFESDGQRYIVARENQPQVDGLAVLTERERQVVASVASGRSNKEIAYELGISDATTRVLLSRAYRRLGVRSREALFALPSIKRLRGEPVT